MVAVPLFVVVTAAVQAVLIVAVALAPADIFNTSTPPAPKSVIVSVPVTVKVSRPAPPVRLLAPKPPTRLSLPVPPIKVSAKLEPVKVVATPVLVTL